uniref:Nuclear receptor domain-containing protein n=1 Tax=Meloidogyne javanica TaxID=6303 RepID=A0A915LDS3_MELJA
MDNNKSLENNNEKNSELSKKERPTDCVVCAKPAKCCHFDVPSCLGCRSFFRRSILNQRSYSCKNNGNCQIGKGELCRSCRFDRCLLGGMDFRTIQKFPDGFSVDKISALLTEKKRQLSEKASIGGLSGIERSEVELLQLLIYFDNNLLYIRHSETDISTSIYFGKSMFDLINSDGGGLTYSILARTDQFSKHRRVAKSYNFYQQRFREGDYSILSPNWLYIDSFLIIEMTKTMPVLQQLSFEDKIRLYSRNGMATVVFSALFYTTSELSRSGYGIIQTEIEKLSKALMFYERSIWGDAGGAMRFTNLMLTLSAAFQISNAHRKFLMRVAKYNPMPNFMNNIIFGNCNY